MIIMYKEEIKNTDGEDSGSLDSIFNVFFSWLFGDKNSPKNIYCDSPVFLNSHRLVTTLLCRQSLRIMVFSIKTLDKFICPNVAVNLSVYWTNRDPSTLSRLFVVKHFNITNQSSSNFPSRHLCDNQSWFLLDICAAIVLDAFIRRVSVCSLEKSRLSRSWGDRRGQHLSSSLMF